MRGSGVNTYRLVDAEGEGVLVKFHWMTRQGEHNLTSPTGSTARSSPVRS
ncbi:catalase [Micromonospora phytophila]|nr:catalase [Micromonospora phytophila]MCM0678659.1 catalase [Micromonospora phytophila]